MKKLIYTLLLSFAFTGSLHAEEKKVGDYIIYYNAFNSSFLQPNVAKTYNIPRTGSTGVLNIAVHKSNDKNQPDAVSANVQGRAKNNISQYEDLAFREIKEDAAIYYLADFQFRHQEEMELKVSIRIPGESEPIELELDKKFYKD